jgi:hypothetical protein
MFGRFFHKLTHLVTLIRVDSDSVDLPSSANTVRVTRFSIIRRLFTLGSFLKIPELAHSLGNFCHSTYMFYINFHKNVSGYLLGDFSQTHLVTPNTVEIHSKYLYREAHRNREDGQTK